MSCGGSLKGTPRALRGVQLAAPKPSSQPYILQLKGLKHQSQTRRIVFHFRSLRLFQLDVKCEQAAVIKAEQLIALGAHC